MKQILIFIMGALLISACSFDPEVIHPAYIKLGNIKVYEPGNNQLLTTHDVRDIWVYYNGKALGVYPYPGHIPVIPDPDVEISNLQFVAGIRENGIADYVNLHPFLDFYELNRKIEPGQTYEVNPEYIYRSNAFLRFNEGFESVSHLFNFDLDNNEGTNIIPSNAQKRSGEYAGLLQVSKNEPKIEAGTSEPILNLPTDTRSVYMELDFLADQDFYFGIIGYDNEAGIQGVKSYFLGFKANDSWQKVYINLTEELAASKFKAYRFFFGMQLLSGKEEGKVYLDNIKLLHY